MHWDYIRVIRYENHAEMSLHMCGHMRGLPVMITSDDGPGSSSKRTTWYNLMLTKH